MKLKRFLNASMILAFLAMSQTALAQAFTVQGRVVDESGEPMIGVAVTNKDGNCP
jgi:protocatechuate 3,4-dioxygenase beta subunit